MLQKMQNPSHDRGLHSQKNILATSIVVEVAKAGKYLKCGWDKACIVVGDAA